MTLLRSIHGQKVISLHERKTNAKRYILGTCIRQWIECSLLLGKLRAPPPSKSNIDAARDEQAKEEKPLGSSFEQSSASAQLADPTAPSAT